MKTPFNCFICGHEIFVDDSRVMVPVSSREVCGTCAEKWLKYLCERHQNLYLDEWMRFLERF